MNTLAINKYLDVNGVTVTGDTDSYYRLSPHGVKAWYVADVSEPTEADLAAYDDYVAAQELEQYKADKLAEINAACDTATGDISSKYPRSEMDTWPQQVREAEAYQADNNVSVPMLETIATAMGITVSDQANRVMQRFTQYADAVGKAVGKRHALEEKIQAATTVEEVQAISW